MTCEQIKAELIRLTDGLLYISETERPFGVLEITGDRAAFFAQQYKLSIADIVCSDATAFFNKLIHNATADPDDAVMQQLAKRYETLQQFMNENFTDLQLHRAGGPEVHLFISGKTADGCTLALHTTAVVT